MAILKTFHITQSNWEHIALDRSSWTEVQDLCRHLCKSVQDGAANHETELCRATEIKHQLCKEKDKKVQPLSQITTFSCPHCTKICRSRIGLYSDLKSHRQTQERGQSYLVRVTTYDDDDDDDDIQLIINYNLFKTFNKIY